MAVTTLASWFPQPPEPGLTPAEVIARADAIAPTLVARQAETEQRTFYALDTHDQFRKAGFYRILVPRRYGGYEFGIETFMRVVIALTRGCPSTGWMYCLGAAHAEVIASLFGERCQDEVFASGEFIGPATVAPSGTAERVDGGWRLTGTWSYCSGSPYATHFVGHTMVPAADGHLQPMMFIAPRSQWKRLEDWGSTLGLRGSGSHSIQMDGGFVPDHWTLDTHLSHVDVSQGTPGLELHGNVEYAGGQLSFMVIEDAALAIGMAKGALDAYEDLMRTRTTMFPPIQPRTSDPDYQLRYGEAVGLIATAEAATMNAVHQWQQAAGAAAITKEQELTLAAICHEAVGLCWQAVANQLFPTAGSSAVRRGERIERVWRDLSMLHTHAGVAVFLRTIAKRELTKARFDVE